MKKVIVVFWSGTGNTEKMAAAIAEGAASSEAEIKLVEVSKASIADVLAADTVALGCPAMGAEVLEESEMEPFIENLEKENLAGKPMALFGSYDWGDGEWMREWADRMKGLGVHLIEEGLIVQNTPDEEGLSRCRQLGVKLASITC